MADMQKMTPCFWYDDKCEEAMNFYVDVFNGNPNKKTDSKVISIHRYEEGMNTPGNDKMIGKVLTGIFELEGQQFMALDGGPVFKFNESISFQVMCQNQEEVDYFFEKMSAVPESEICGWIKDKFGLSWQIIPKRLTELLQDPDKEKSHRVMNVMLEMGKINVKELEDAYGGK